MLPLWMDAYPLSFTAPCRSEDVESMVKVSWEQACGVSLNTYVYWFREKRDKKFKRSNPYGIFLYHLLFFTV